MLKFKKAVILSILAILLVLAPPIYSYFSTASWEGVIQNVYRLDPMRPPRSGYGPGSVYSIDFFGNIVRQVCNMDNSITVMQKSKTVETNVVSNFIISLGLKSKFSKLLKLDGKSNSERKVNISIKEPYFFELDAVNTSRILDSTPDGKNCMKEIEKYIDKTFCIVQSFKVLRASTKFDIIDSANGVIVLDDTDESNNLFQNISLEIGLGNNIKSSGNSLLFGYEMQKRCIRREGQTTIFTPNTRWWHMIAIVNGLYWIKERISQTF